MQQDISTDSAEQQQEPDWTLASYGQRVGAWLLDFVGFALPMILMVVGGVVLVLGLIFSSEHMWRGGRKGRGRMFGEDSFARGFDFPEALIIIAAVMMGIMAIVIAIGYIVWWLIALGRGQTPGKQIVGIRVIKDNGEPSGWGYTFLREFVIKLLLVGFLSDATFGIARLVDYLWPLWDRAEKMQTLHDKLLGTIVVRNR